MFTTSKLQFLLILSLFFLNSSSYAKSGTVRAIIKNKYVAVDVGKLDGYDKKTKVCLYDQDKKIACGIVVNAKDKRAFVRVKADKIALVKKGMRIELYQASPQVAGSKEDEQTQPTETSEENSNASNFKLGYLATAFSVSSYDVISYEFPYEGDPPTKETSVESLWEAENSSSSTPIGVASEFSLALGSSMRTNIGARFRLFKTTNATSNLNDTQENNELVDFAETKIASSAVGVWIDFYYLNIKVNESFSLEIGNGLDFDQSRVELVMNEKSDIDEEKALEAIRIKSSLGTVSLRTNFAFNYYLDPLGFQLTTSISVPLSSQVSQKIEQTESTDSSFFNDKSLLGDDKKVEEDLISKLNHRASGFGLEIMLSAYYGF